MKKRLLVMVLAFAMAVSVLAACGQGGTASTTSAPAAETTVAAEITARN